MYRFRFLYSRHLRIIFSSSDDDVQAPVSEEKTGWTDQVRMIHLRRYINQLAEKVQEKDYTVQKTRYNLHFNCLFCNHFTF